MINYLLQQLVIFVVENIGIRKESDQLQQICFFVFLAQFINTGIIPILSTANFSDTILEFIPLRNFYKDFSEQWYLDIGCNIIKTMCV